MVEVEAFFQKWSSTQRAQRSRLVPAAPLASIQRAAIDHPDAWTRRRCLGYLDHHASDASTGVFLTALADPVGPVRAIALHGLACEPCRTEELCAADVGPTVASLLERDPDPEVQVKTIPVLLRLADRYPGGLQAIELAAHQAGDERVREAARSALLDRPRRWSHIRRRVQARSRAGDSRGTA